MGSLGNCRDDHLGDNAEPFYAVSGRYHSPYLLTVVTPIFAEIEWHAGSPSNQFVVAIGRQLGTLKEIAKEPVLGN